MYHIYLFNKYDCILSELKLENTFFVDTFDGVSCSTVGASGNVQCVDLIYSGSTSLMTKIGTLAIQTALNAKLNLNNPAYTGTISNADNSFIEANRAKEI